TDRDRAVDVASSLAQRGPGAALDLVSEAEPSSGVDLVRIVAPDGSPMAARVTRGLQNVESLPVPRAGQVVEHDLVAPSGTDLRVTSVGVNVGGLTFGVDVGTDTERYDTMLTAGAVLFLAFVPVAGLVTAVFVHLARAGCSGRWSRSARASPRAPCPAGANASRSRRPRTRSRDWRAR